jgi:hypothetical protein
MSNRLHAALVALTVAIAGHPPAAWSDTLAEQGILQLHYKKGMHRTSPAFKKNYGEYLGSGTGTIRGKVRGSVVWDLYEEQSDPNLHRTQFVGRITASDGSVVSFETSGYFIPRSGDEHYWDLTSAIYFADANGAAYQRLAGRIGLWEGHVDIRSDRDGDGTFSHTYRLYLPAQTN